MVPSSLNIPNPHLDNQPIEELDPIELTVKVTRQLFISVNPSISESSSEDLEIRVNSLKNAGVEAKVSNQKIVKTKLEEIQNSIIENFSKFSTENDKFGCWWRTLLTAVDKITPLPTPPDTSPDNSPESTPLPTIDPQVVKAKNLVAKLHNSIQSCVEANENAYRSKLLNVRDINGIVSILNDAIEHMNQKRLIACNELLQLPLIPTIDSINETGNCSRCVSYITNDNPPCKHCIREDILKDYHNTLYAYKKKG